MKLLLAIIFLYASNALFAQDTLKIYRWEAIQKANPDTILGIDASKLKWEQIPEKLYSFKNLENAPIVICQLPKLQKLHLARNKISSLPACIGYLSELRVLDIWDNPINILPEEVSNLKKLEAVDMRAIMLGPHFQQKWQESMPQVKWYFDPPCHCVE